MPNNQRPDRTVCEFCAKWEDRCECVAETKRLWRKIASLESQLAEARRREADIPQMLLCAFRYSLGRKTYIVGNCCEWLERYWTLLPVGWRSQIHGDIKRAIEHNDAGMDCDVAEWRKVLQLEVNDAATKEQPRHDG
jgi:hypothetical protein